MSEPTPAIDRAGGNPAFPYAEARELEGAAKAALARMFRAALRSAASECPHETQEKVA